MSKRNPETFSFSVEAEAHSIAGVGENHSSKHHKQNWKFKYLHSFIGLSLQLSYGSSYRTWNYFFQISFDSFTESNQNRIFPWDDDVVIVDCRACYVFWYSNQAFCKWTHWSISSSVFRLESHQSIEQNFCCSDKNSMQTHKCVEIFFFLLFTTLSELNVVYFSWVRDMNGDCR